MTDLVLPPGTHGNERVVEYNWVLSKLKPNTSILDVGTVAPPIMCGYPEFVFQVTRRLQCKYVTMDIMPGANILGDIKTIELQPKSVDTIVCISTLEHITLEPEIAVENMLRIGKQILITMPFGFRHEMPWGFQYDYGRLEKVFRSSLQDFQMEFYRHYEDGWKKCNAPDLEGLIYWSSGCDGASGVVCMEYPSPQVKARESAE